MQGLSLETSDLACGVPGMRKDIQLAKASRLLTKQGYDNERFALELIWGVQWLLEHLIRQGMKGDPKASLMFLASQFTVIMGITECLS